MKQTNSKRKREKHARNYGDRAPLVQQMKCIAEAHLRTLPPYDFDAPERKGDPKRCSPGIHACHDQARGMGGCGGDRFSLFAACGTHHAEAGPRGTSDRAAFEALYDCDVTATAKRIAAELTERGIL